MCSLTHITCTNAEAALQFGTAASWWQRCHAAYAMMQVNINCDQDCKYGDSPNCHTLKKSHCQIIRFDIGWHQIQLEHQPNVMTSKSSIGNSLHISVILEALSLPQSTMVVPDMSPDMSFISQMLAIYKRHASECVLSSVPVWWLWLANRIKKSSSCFWKIDRWVGLNVPPDTLYRVGQKNGPFLKVYDSCIWWGRKAIYISKCWALYQE